MAINIIISVQYILPDIILMTQGYYHRGTRLNAMSCRDSVFTAYETVYIITTMLNLILYCFIDATHARGKVLRALRMM